MKKQRIAVLTYRKFAGELCAAQEFRPCQVRLINGEQVTMEMAERGLQLSNQLWVREVRHLTEKGLQDSIVSTYYRSDLSQVAGTMFARWCQENFFKYMRQHYNIDRLIQYGTEAIPDTTRVINPAWRQLDSQIRRQNGLLSRELVQFAQIELPQEMEPEAVQAYERQKSQMQQVIEERRQQIKQLKVQRKTKPKHIESKICLSKIDFSACVQKKNTSSTPSNSSLPAETALAELAPRSNAWITPAPIRHSFHRDRPASHRLKKLSPSDCTPYHPTHDESSHISKN